MRRRQLARLVKRLKQLQPMKFNARQLLIKLGEAKARYRAAWRLIEITIPERRPAAQPYLKRGHLALRATGRLNTDA